MLLDITYFVLGIAVVALIIVVVVGGTLELLWGEWRRP
jgi:hypothetical protein